MNASELIIVVLLISINTVNFSIKNFYLNLEIVKNTFKISINIGFSIMKKDTSCIKM